MLGAGGGVGAAATGALDLAGAGFGASSSQPRREVVTSRSERSELSGFIGAATVVLGG